VVRVFVSRSQQRRTVENTRVQHVQTAANVPRFGAVNILLQFELFAFPGASCLMQKRMEVMVIPPIGTDVVVMPGMNAPVTSITWDLGTADMILRLNMGMVRDANRAIEQLAPLGWTVAREEVWSQ